MRRLNIGAGGDIRPVSEGWMNADIRSLPGIDVICDARDLPFTDGAFDEVLARDLIEHIPPAETRKALEEWTRVLRPGGTLSLRFPDLRKIVRRFLAYHWDPNPARSDDTGILLIYGDQRADAGGTEWGSHKTGFTEAQIRRLLGEFGYEGICVTAPEHEHNLVVDAVKG